ncbi:MAG: hypothetical protein N2746_04435 [Deltaproteobacteria bacterium]|nr:hypothetical protein [Deltaproteobacteria bacterium]
MRFETVATRDEMEDILDKKSTIIKTPKDRAAVRGFSPDITPNAVATPFPPLNFKNKENICPNTARNPLANPMLLSKNLVPKITGSRPFEKSHKKVNNPGIIPTVLITFAVPMFPEPMFLISLPLKALENNRPNGIEPII